MLSLIQKFLKLGLKEPKGISPDRVLDPGPVFVRIIKRCYEQGKLGDERARRVIWVMSLGPTMIGVRVGKSYFFANGIN